MELSVQEKEFSTRMATINRRGIREIVGKGKINKMRVNDDW